MLNRLITPFKNKEPDKTIQQLTHLWLQSFQLCVNQKDYALAQTLFSPKVVAFGTVAASASDIDSIVSEQWEKSWPKMESFELAIDEAKMLAATPYIMSVLLWQAKDLDGADIKGRATIILMAKKDKDGPVELKCCHSHFSISP